MLKILSIFICFFCVTGCTSPYHEHFFRENPEFITEENPVSGEVFISNGRLSSLPNKFTHSELIETIHLAKKRIWIEIYTWTDAAKLTDPIIQAKKRGIDVRVVLEGNVFGTPKINVSVVRKLKDSGIQVMYADNHRYKFTHAKFWIIDDTYSISTGNWTASFFNKNREYIYTGNDLRTLSFLETLFDADFKHLGFKDVTLIPAHIVISPLDSRSKIEKLILWTKKDIMIYIQTLDDEHILSLLHDLSLQKKNIKVCTADNDTNHQRMLQFPEISWNMIRKPYLHAKIIIIDHSQVFIGSHNLTTNAIENNREIGMILDHRDDLIHKIESDFILDGCK